MQHLLNIPWASTFEPHQLVLDIILRGSVTYLVLFLLLRIIPKRESGSGASGITDFLVVRTAS